jgi:ABC-type antimicrobial peptide transport system permease subunit
MSLEAKPQTTTKVAQLDQADERIKGDSLWMDAWRRLRRNRAATMGMVIIIVMILLAVFAPFCDASWHCSRRLHTGEIRLPDAR